MIEIKYSQDNAQLGKINGVLRVIGTMVFLKMTNSPQSRQIVNQMQNKGARIIKGTGDWVKIDMFSAHTELGKEDFKLANKEFNINTTPIDEIEKIISEFYVINFNKAQFYCEVKYV